MEFSSTHRSWSRRLEAEFGVWDLTPELEALTAESGVTSGILSVQVVGSTAAITTIEYEPGALEDLRRALDRLLPTDADYAHNERWHDGNGFSHIRSAVLKTGITIPVIAGRPAVGTWQQVVVINLDNRTRDREVVGVVVGGA